MSKVLIITLLCFLLLGACTVRNQEQNRSYAIAVVDDQTDPILAHPYAEPILSFLSLSDNLNASVDFQYKIISDRVLMPDTHITLPNGEGTEKLNTGDEVMFREKLVLHFFDTLRSCFAENKRKSDTSHYFNSECFRKISEAISNVSANDAEIRLVLIYSNLQENSNLFNCYSKANMLLAESYPKNVVTLFKNTNQVPTNLSGISVTFIYQPVNREDEHTFMIMATVYKSLLEEYGATVYIQADNKNIRL